MRIEVDISVGYGEFQLTAAFRLQEAGVTVIYGPSGSGKTTLLRSIAGLERQCRGTIRVGEETWLDGQSPLPPHQRQVGYVFQHTHLFPHLSVAENLRYGWKRAVIQRDEAQLTETSSTLGLAHLLERGVTKLSGGERQRVAIGRAILTNPRLLLMDEPISSLDDESKQALFPLIRGVVRRAGIPCLYVTHSMAELTRLADQVLLMEAGRVVALGSAQQMLTRLDLPLALREDAEVFLLAEVAGYDENYGINVLRYSGGRLLVAGPQRTIGDRVRVRILAKDVSITTEPPGNTTSILNILLANVEALASPEKSQVTARLRIGEQSLLARISKRSADVLDLKPGRQVYAQIKSVAMMT